MINRILNKKIEKIIDNYFDKKLLEEMTFKYIAMTIKVRLTYTKNDIDIEMRTMRTKDYKRILSISSGTSFEILTNKDTHERFFKMIDKNVKELLDKE
jgi:hypothetical protein